MITHSITSAQNVCWQKGWSNAVWILSSFACQHFQKGVEWQVYVRLLYAYCFESRKACTTQGSSGVLEILVNTWCMFVHIRCCHEFQQNAFRDNNSLVGVSSALYRMAMRLSNDHIQKSSRPMVGFLHHLSVPHELPIFNTDKCISVWNASCLEIVLCRPLCNGT